MQGWQKAGNESSYHFGAFSTADFVQILTRTMLTMEAALDQATVGSVERMATADMLWAYMSALGVFVGRAAEIEV